MGAGRSLQTTINFPRIFQWHNAQQYEHFVPSDENSSRNVPVVCQYFYSQVFQQQLRKGYSMCKKNIPSGYDGGEKETKVDAKFIPGLKKNIPSGYDGGEKETKE
jgi:hypothetical protein